RLNGSEARIEGRTALSKSGDREKKAYGWNQGGQAHPPMRCLGRLLVNHDPDSAWHWLLQRLQCSRDMPEIRRVYISRPILLTYGRILEIVAAIGASYGS